MNDIVKLPRLLAARLEKVSAIEGVSADAIVRAAIAERLRYHGRSAPLHMATQISKPDAS